MPSSKSSMQHPVWDAWLPRQALLQPSIEHNDAEIEDLDSAKTDENPLIYFPTPTSPPFADGEGMDFDMDFDAGIEDAKHPPPIVRSVSPSSLAGLSRPPPRPPTPPRSPATPDLEYDLSATPDDHEEYDYMDSSSPPRHADTLSLSRRLKDKFRGHTKHEAGSPDSLAPPAPPHSPRGRAVSRSGPKPIAASTGAGSSTRARRARNTPSRLSPHAWREPSPDVWAIEEQPEEEELSSEMGSSSFMEDGTEAMRTVDIPAAKPKKKVRFVLPAMEDDRGAL
ncbi:152a070a-84ee-44ba-8a01-5def51f2b86c [Thermothielavioides terrestris]|uniref:Uncharacterized protein n=2 Tax=Thermothielavioides terrestris TaxID=2587410 RepID=G2QXV8_THETT|nr:uncharacterized protein THITE_2108168 [Thermothielavioides terrestris NRRL 8126]AEO63226.1 hypothetical protein THITE_2108168 [Thermothielavioides terrestris NRRL 8126]SPQ21285.1 152a070a-84ee-44ba-8a01-5def51f2b86c [Thermothielavioides terrestris]